MADAATISTQRAEDGAVTVSLHGALDAASVASSWDAAMGVLRPAPPRTLTLDLSGVTRCDSTGLGMLARLRDAGVDVSRDGTGRILEAYPAVALMQWGLAVGGPYKGTDRARASANLTLLVDALRNAAPWLDLGGHEELCRRNDDAFDAVICALIARAHLLGDCTKPTGEQERCARTEGWIAVPQAPLAALLA